MPTSKRSTAQSKEAELINRPLSDFKDVPVVKDLMSDKFTHGTNAEATEIAMALRQLISGQQVLLQNQSEQAEQIAKIRAKMAAMDAAAQRWEEDRERFSQEIQEKADRLRTRNPDSIIANGVQEYQNAIMQAKAEIVTDRLKFRDQLRHMPTVTVVSPGELMQVMEGGRPVTRIAPEVVRIKDMQWVLQPGVPTDVPDIVAKALRDRRHSEEETRAREDVLTKNYEQPVLQQKWADINSRYKSPTQ